MAEKVKGTVREALAYGEAGVKYNKELEDSQKQQVSLYKQINSLQKKVTDRVKEQSSFVSGLTGEYQKQQELRKLLSELAEKELNATERANIEKRVQGINKELENSAATGEAFAQLFPSFGSGIAGMESGFKAVGRVLTSGPLAIVAVILGIAMTLMRIAKQVNATREQFGMSAKAALKLNFELKKASIAAKAFGLSGEQVRESFDAVAQKFGDVGPAAVQFSVELARIARNTGLGVENTAELVSLYSAAGNVTKSIALNMIDTVTSMAEAAGVSRGILMKELAGQADLFASFVGKGEENLIKAAAAAKKVGMEFGGLVELGDGLLDVTERINKEQTLSTILGRQISLERFAQLNAAGELEAAQQELSNQLQGINNLSAQQTRLFAEQLGIATSDIVRLTGLRSDMPRAGGSFQNEEKKQTGLLSQIVDNTKVSAKHLRQEFGS